MQKHFLLLLFSLLIIGFSACDDSFSTNPNHKLSFSVDTLRFDTVFTNIGSATARVMIYNRNDQALNIQRVSLNDMGDSFFRINVDGMVNDDNSVSDVEIGAYDSLYMFVEVTVDPTNQNTPLFVNDQICFQVNDNTQKIELEAYGQDVEILKQEFIYNDTILQGDKPYLVYDYVAIDTAKTLTLAAGCTMYFHAEAQLVVYGHLKAEGTLEKPVLLRGDRLDDMLTDVPYNSASGQWDGVYLLYEHGKHELNYFHMNSGYNGLYLSNEHTDHCPSLQLNNSRIHNFTYYGLVVQNANVNVVNTEISNCGTYCVYLSGGEHSFIHSTVANYYNFPATMLHPTVREDKPAVCINDIPKLKAPMKSVFKNCIVAGSRTNEFGLYTTFPDKYDGVFENNLIQSDSLQHFPQFRNNAWIPNSSHPDQHTQQAIVLFKNIRYESANEWEYYNFQLDSASLACGVGNADVSAEYSYDKNGASRLQDTQPDAGAYEYVEQ